MIEIFKTVFILSWTKYNGNPCTTLRLVYDTNLILIDQNYVYFDTILFLLEIFRFLWPIMLLKHHFSTLLFCRPKSIITSRLTFSLLNSNCRQLVMSRIVLSIYHRKINLSSNQRITWSNLWIYRNSKFCHCTFAQIHIECLKEVINKHSVDYEPFSDTSTVLIISSFPEDL